jgi:hypothetical protein
MSETKAPNSTGKSPDRRKLTAVVHADVVGYSRLIGLNDIGTLERLRALRTTLIDPAIDEHSGRFVNTEGDPLLIVFDSVEGAVRCAVKVHISDRDQPPDRAMRFRVAINVGDVIRDGTDVHGDVVNVAARRRPSGGLQPIVDLDQCRSERATAGCRLMLGLKIRLQPQGIGNGRGQSSCGRHC